MKNKKLKIWSLIGVFLFVFLIPQSRTEALANTAKVNNKAVDMSLNIDSYEFKDYTPVQLTQKDLPNNSMYKKLIWKSNNPNIASVNSEGIVTPVSNGVTQVYLMRNNGDKIAIFDVTVNIEQELINKNTYRQVAYVVKPWENAATALAGIEKFKNYNYGSVLLCIPIDNNFENNEPFTQVTEKLLDQVVAKCESMGLEVTLKAHNVGTLDDGMGNRDTPENPQKWFENYKVPLMFIADMAVKYGQDKIIISNEMNQVMNVAAWKPYMVPVINAVKDKGLKVAPSLNIPEITELDGYQYFDEVDFITVNAYPQLTKQSLEWARQNHEALKDGFYEVMKYGYYDVDYGKLLAEIGGPKNAHKDVWITEIGAMPNTDGLWAPAYWGNKAKYNEETQKLYLDAMFDVLENDRETGKLTNRLKKYTLWDGNSNSDFNPIGKEGQVVLDKYWAPTKSELGESNVIK